MVERLLLRAGLPWDAVAQMTSEEVELRAALEAALDLRRRDKMEDEAWMSRFLAGGGG